MQISLIFVYISTILLQLVLSKANTNKGDVDNQPNTERVNSKGDKENSKLNSNLDSNSEQLLNKDELDEENTLNIEELRKEIGLDMDEVRNVTKEEFRKGLVKTMNKYIENSNYTNDEKKEAAAYHEKFSTKLTHNITEFINSEDIPLYLDIKILERIFKEMDDESLKEVDDSDEDLEEYLINHAKSLNLTTKQNMENKHGNIELGDMPYGEIPEMPEDNGEYIDYSHVKDHPDMKEMQAELDKQNAEAEVLYLKQQKEAKDKGKRRSTDL